MLPTVFATYFHPALASALGTDPAVGARHTVAAARAAGCPASHVLSALNVHLVNGWRLTPALIRAVRPGRVATLVDEDAATADLQVLLRIALHEAARQSGIARQAHPIAQSALDPARTPEVRAAAAFVGLRAAVHSHPDPCRATITCFDLGQHHERAGDPVLRGIAELAWLAMARIAEQVGGERRDGRLPRDARALYRRVIETGNPRTRYPLEAAWRLARRSPTRQHLRILEDLVADVESDEACHIVERRADAEALLQGGRAGGWHARTSLPEAKPGPEPDPLADRRHVAALQAWPGPPEARPEADAFLRRCGGPPDGMEDTGERPHWEPWLRAALELRETRREPAGTPLSPHPGVRLLQASRRSRGVWRGAAPRRWQEAVATWLQIAEDPLDAADAARALGLLAGYAAIGGTADDEAGRLARTALRLVRGPHARRSPARNIIVAQAKLVIATVELAAGRGYAAARLRDGGPDVNHAMAAYCEGPPFSAVYERLVEMLVRQPKEILAPNAEPLLPLMPVDTAYTRRVRALLAAACDRPRPDGVSEREMANARRQAQELRPRD